MADNPTFEFDMDGLVVTARLLSPHNPTKIVLEAEEARLAATWGLEIEDTRVPTLTNNMCNRGGEQVIHILNAAKAGNQGLTLSVRKGKHTQEDLILGITEEAKQWRDTKNFTLALEAVKVDQLDRVERELLTEMP